MNNPGPAAIFGFVSNPLRDNNLVRGAWCAVVAVTLACGGAREQAHQAMPPVTAPLPTGGLAGQRVAVFPLTLVAAEDSLHWEPYLANRWATLASADSVFVSLLVGRVPEVAWVPPEALRRAARRAAGVAPNPAQMGTAVLRAEGLVDVPDPLRSQLRTVIALAGEGGGRYVLIPAALVYRRPRGPMPSAAASAGPARGTAELSVVLVDVRVGKVQWRTVARGDGGDPWAALTQAVKALTPGLP